MIQETNWMSWTRFNYPHVMMSVLVRRREISPPSINKTSLISQGYFPIDTISLLATTRCLKFPVDTPLSGLARWFLPTIRTEY